jgi:cholesterol transport system auxiliary component
MIDPSDNFAITRRYFLACGGIAGVAIALAGCSSVVGPGTAPQLYILRPDLQPVAGVPAVSWQLEILTPDTPQGLDTNRIALINPPTRMNYYADASWPDRLPQLLQSLMVQAFERSGKIAAVASGTSALHADYLLLTEIHDFSAHYDTPDSAPVVAVALEVKLIRSRGRTIVANIGIDRRVQADANSVDSVVLAFNRALSDALKKIVAWALTAPPDRTSQS